MAPAVRQTGAITGPARRAKERLRSGFSLLELQVALVLFAVALAGLYPLTVMHSRQLKRLEQRFAAGTDYYMIPSSDAWARKLGAAGQVRTTDPGPPPAPAVLVLDNGDSAYSETGAGWGAETQPQAYRGDHRWHASGDGTSTAAWEFSGLVPGWYDMRITWREGGNRASNAPFTIHDGLTNRGTFPVNQTLAPAGGAYDGAVWQSIAIVPIASGSAQAVLTDGTDGRVVADGVRLVPVRNTVQINSLTRTLTGEDVSAQVSVTVVTP